MKTRGSRGRVRRKAVWGTETSEPVAGCYERAHGRAEGDSEQKPCRLFSRKNEWACALDVEGMVAKRAESPYDDNPTGRRWVTITNLSDSQKEGRGDLFTRAG